MALFIQYYKKFLATLKLFQLIRKLSIGYLRVSLLNTVNSKETKQVVFV